MSSAYQVLARKWRPKQFDDVIGQEHVTRTLKNAITEDRVAHAYLFVGPRGTGKTSTARIFAKALNCQKGPTTTPCDQCESCTEIMKGSSLDVIEIDAASNTQVDHIRALRENVQYAPARSLYKIYIIDEVHMLSSGSFNALLKTLEEPPPHVKFVLATTDPQKVPITIHSRCQRFDLRRIAVPALADALQRIAQVEGVDVDHDALLAIARGAEGGMRDAQSAFDQLISFIGTTIREPDVLSVFGLVSRQAMEALVSAILTGDVGAIIHAIADMDEAGKDMQRLIIELLQFFRDLLVFSYAPKALNTEFTDIQVAALKNLTQQTEPDRVLQIIQILIDTDSRLRYALSRRTLVETALIRSAHAATVTPIDALIKQLTALRQEITGQPPAPATLSIAAPDPRDEPVAKKKRGDPSVITPETAPPPPAIPSDVPNSEHPVPPPPKAADTNTKPKESPRPAPAASSPARREPEEDGPPLTEPDEVMDTETDMEMEMGALPASPASPPPPPQPRVQEIPARPTTPPPPTAQCKQEHQRLYGHWHELIEQAGHMAPLASQYLVDAKPFAVDGHDVTIGIDPEFSSELDNVDVPRNRKALQKVLGRFLNRDIVVHFKLLEPGETLPTDIKLPEGHTQGKGNTSPAPLSPEAMTAEQRWIRDPHVRKVLEEFNGEIIDIRE